HKELAAKLDEQQGTCGLDFAGGPGNCAEPAESAFSGGGRNEDFYAMKEELERKARETGQTTQAPNVQLFTKKADFEAFHLKAGEV
ncbi:MAG: nitrate reductase subunit beta, partial [Rubrobacter sp.]|nr:nitrate reductase subunit beta [Rubrobacter sp.]